MKLLVINLQNPASTKYRNPKTIGSWMLGRRIDNYRLYTLNDNGGLVPIVLINYDTSSIQEEVNTAMGI